jgi:pseudouridine synthase
MSTTTMETTTSGDPADSADDLVRLNKYLADRGIASRRKCDELIAKGKVSIDGEPVSVLGTKIDPDKQSVEVDGVVLKAGTSRKRYYLLNKPRGVICTNEKREARTRAVDLISDRDKGRIYTVGRLDEDSQGLILLTNDGEFTHLVSHPRNGVPKTYVAKIRGRIESEEVARLRAGVRLAEGRTARAAVRIEQRTFGFSTLRVTLREGKNREVRRIFAALGFKVTHLRRTHIGPLSDRRLKEGTWRPLTRAEVAELIAVASDRKLADAVMSRAATPVSSRRGGRPKRALKADRDKPGARPSQAKKKRR